MKRVQLGEREQIQGTVASSVNELEENTQIKYGK